MILAALFGLAECAEPVLVTAERVVDDTWSGEHDALALRRAALKGMLAHLNARESVPVNRLLEGAVREAAGPWGLGLEYLLVPGRGLLVTRVVLGSAAERAGIVPGDVVTSLDGRDTREAGDPTAVPALHGGSVELLVERAGGHVARFLLEPGALPHHELAPHGDHLCVAVRQPDASLAASLAEALAAAPEQALVLDLRGASGGTVVGAAGLADVLLPEGALIGWELRAGTRHELRAARAGHGGPAAVLVDEATAGPAELVAASLQHHGRAPVVGTPSAGWAGATRVRFLDEHFALELVDARLRDPAGRSWDGQGVVPDLRIQPPLLLPPEGVLPRDAQLEAALAALGLEPPR